MGEGGAEADGEPLLAELGHLVVVATGDDDRVGDTVRHYRERSASREK